MSVAPGSPSSVTTVNVTANDITVQWGEVPCLDSNGEITGYTVLLFGEGENDTTTLHVAGDAREATISGLSPSTEYTLQISAVNDAGNGKYSAGSFITTTSKCSHDSR